MAEATPERRAKIDDHGSRVVVTIPPVRSCMAVPITAFLLFWLCGWAAGEYFAGREAWKILQKMSQSGWGNQPEGWFPLGFLLFWLTGWTLGGAFAILTVLGLWLGTERLEASYEGLKLVRWPVPIPRRYPLGQITNLRVLEAPDLSALPSKATVQMARGLQRMAPGTIGFDFGKQTVRFGSGLSQAEAGEIVEMLRGRFGMG